MKTAICKIFGTLILAASAVANAQFQYVTNSDGLSLTITGYSGTVPATLTIPDAINGLSVTDIGESAFSGADTLASVTIPPTVTSIGECAFCVSGLRDVTIPASVTNIAEAAFSNCDSLTNVSIPESVVSIGPETFAASGLTSVSIPGNVSCITYAAFASCPNLTNVTIGYGIGSIQTNAFISSITLTNVTIPASVTNIGDSAFAECIQLTNVFFVGSAPDVEATSFQNNLLIGGQYPSNYYAATAYYLPGTTGWAEFSANAMIPAVLWNPVIQATGANFGVHLNQFGFDITGTTNIPIVVEACTDLAQSVWVSLQSMTLTNGLVHFSEPLRPNTPARFYRIGAP